jgi:hypothetical protein
MNGFSGPSYLELDASRRGYGQVGGPLNPPSNIPTVFARPFKTPGSGSLVPLTALEHNDINGTLLRRWEWEGQIPDPDDTAVPPQQITIRKAWPMFQSRTLGQANDARRNSYFRYQNLHRLGNMITTRSNVYAIWITVGYFEMEPNLVGGSVQFDAYHPEGLRVGQEIGIDTGEVQRHRAFFMVDRTIPVAFQPGQNHNVDRCVILRRYIE